MNLGTAYVGNNTWYCNQEDSDVQFGLITNANKLTGIMSRLIRTYRKHKDIASAAAVASSSNDALATSRPVNSEIIVWKLRSPSSRP